MTVKLSLSSPAFAHHARIPQHFTGDGADVSPALVWDGVPSNTQTFALVMDDPDAPGGVWAHWLVYDLPAGTRGLAEGASPTGGLPAGAKEGKNSWGRIGYGGPAPPPGKPHRYVFKLYALSSPTGLAVGAGHAALAAALAKRTLAEAQWIGIYGR